MSEKKMDRRVRKTKLLLRQGLAKLMLEKSIKEITVKELTELVDINRGTFYIHYRDIYDLIDKVEDDIFKEFYEIINSYSDEIGDAPIPLLVDIYQYLAENADLCAAFLGENGDMVFVEKLKNIFKGKFFSTWTIRYQEIDPEKFDYFYSFVVSGHIGLIQTWLAHGMKESPEEMAAMSGNMVLYGAAVLE